MPSVNEGKNDYVLTNGVSQGLDIYEKKASEILDEIIEKEAGVIGRLVGSNVGKAERNLKKLAPKVDYRRLKLESKTNTPGVVGKAFGKKEVPTYSKREINRRMAPHDAQVNTLKDKMTQEQKKSFKTRVKAITGATVVGAGAYKIKDMNSPKSTNMYNTASVEVDSIEKVAMNLSEIINRLKPVASGAQLKRSKQILREFKDGVNTINHPELDRAITVNSRRAVLSKKNEDLVARRPAQRSFDERYDDAITTDPAKLKEKFALNRELDNTISNINNEIKKNNALLGELGDQHASIRATLGSQVEKDYSKIIGLYGIPAGGIGYGIHKLMKNKKKEK